MKIYNYDKNTKEYISTIQATESPLEKGEYLIPANATTVSILNDKIGFTQIFDKTKNNWNYIEDNRGKIVYDTVTKQKSKVDYIGAIKSGFTELVPKANDKWNGTKWIFDIVSASTAKAQAIKSDLQNYLKSYTLASGTVVKNSIQDQANNLKNIALSQQAMQANKWVASTDVTLNSVANISGAICLCTTAGKTGAAAPTPPTKFGVTVTDNTATWKLLGFLVNTDKGRVYFTPQSVLEMSQEIALILNEALTKYDKLKVQIKTAKTQTALNKIKWS